MSPVGSLLPFRATCWGHRSFNRSADTRWSHKYLPRWFLADQAPQSFQAHVQRAGNAVIHTGVDQPLQIRKSRLKLT